MENNIKTLIGNKDYEGIRRLLENSPHLANEGITIPFDNNCLVKAHPLHRICDAVFAKKITDEEAVEIAKIFMEFGADIEGSKNKVNEDTPLLAASSLHAEQLGIFYIDNGADIHLAGRNDGATALHWAAYCGRDQLVEKLIQKKAVIDKLDTSYNSTSLAWAVQPLQSGDNINDDHQVACIKLLLKAGAEIQKLNNEKIKHLQLLAKEDVELRELLHQ